MDGGACKDGYSGDDIKKGGSCLEPALLVTSIQVWMISSLPDLLNQGQQYTRRDGGPDHPGDVGTHGMHQ